MYRIEEINECLVETHRDTDYLIISKEFAENLLKEIDKNNFGRFKLYNTIQELKLNPPMYLGIKVFVDEDLEGDTFEIR